MDPNNQKLLSDALGGKLSDYKEKLSKIGFIDTKFPATEGDEGTTAALDKFIKQLNLAHNGYLDKNLLDKALTKASSDADKLGATAVTGRVLMDYGEPASGLRLRLRVLRFGEAKPQFVGDDVFTDTSGLFKLPFDPATDIGVEVVAIDDKGETRTLSLPMFAPGGESNMVALVAPTELKPPLSEFDRLLSSVKEKIGDADLLAHAQDRGGNPEQSDIALLAGQTGWDARLIALAANAKQLERATGQPFNVSYALVRSGLPTDAASLAKVSSSIVRDALQRAESERIAPLKAEEIDAAVALHAKLSKDSLLARPLNAQGKLANDFLKQVVDSPDDIQRFEQSLFERATGTATVGSLWDVARKNKVSDKTISKLKLQGKLAALTGANLEVMSSLMSEMDIGKPLDQLAKSGLYKPDAWQKKLEDLAQGDPVRLEKLIPQAPEGVTIEQRMKAYTSVMADRFRVAYPTQSILQRIAADELPVNVATRSKVVELLDEAVKDGGFRLGRTPISALTRNLDETSETKAVLERLHSLYQVTPDDETLKRVWKEKDIGSAFDIAAVPLAEWLARFRKPTNELDDILEKLRRMHHKSVQVVSTIQTFYCLIESTRTTPAMPVLAAASDASLEKQLKDRFPTLQNMIGDMSYEECEHCRSVLSPAAYFVDVLRMLDHADATGKRPFDVLDARRPDLAALPLTCANTSTSLPYIDVVNEILECLAEDKALVQPGDGLDEHTTEELVAEPLDTRPLAYEALAKARYPLSLPFDLPWEQAVATGSLLDVRLEDLIAAFATDDLDRKDALSFPSRHELAMSRLGISPALEFALTDVGSLAGWFSLYGEKAADEASDELQSAQTLASRLGVTSVELADIVRSQFVNPRLDTLVTLQKLGLGLSEVLRERKEPKLSTLEQANFELRLDALRKRFQAAGSDFDARKWLDERWAAKDFDDVLVLAETKADGSFDSVFLRTGSGKKPDNIHWLRLNQFVRLMRHFKWTVLRTDQVLTALYPGGLKALKSGDLWFERTKGMLRHIAFMRELETSLKLGADAEMFLPALWVPIPSTGVASLYARLFLRDGTAAPFDDPEGRYLNDAGLKVDAFQQTLTARLGIDAAGIRLVLGAGQTLNMNAVSSLYRHAQLARAMEIPVSELVALRRMSGIDPFGDLGEDPKKSWEATAQSVRFVQLVQSLRGLRLSVTRVSYWIEGGPASDAGGASIALDKALEAWRKELLPAALQIGEAPDAAAVEHVLGQILATWKLAGKEWRELVEEKGVLPLSSGNSLVHEVLLALAGAPPFQAGQDALTLFSAAVDLSAALNLTPSELVLTLRSNAIFGGENQVGVLSAFGVLAPV